MAAADLESRESAEIDAVRRWRLEELRRAGYEEDDARKLAVQLDVDLHYASSLVRRGCPSSIAVRIAG